MKKRSRSASPEPTMVVHHVREIQLRLLAVGAVAVLGMILGYIFHEQLFAFIKAPLNEPLHYTSPAGSFTFIIKICVTLGIIVALPVAVYNIIMFAQPAFRKRLSMLRVHLTTLTSLVLAAAGASFAFFVIIPLALRFFYKFQVSGLEAIISADEYFRFVLSVIVTFVLIFQLPLIVSFIDHVTPLPPKKLFKAEKYIIVGSVLIAVVVPFALDPTVQLLIASPIIILYNLSIVIVLMQHVVRSRRQKKASKNVQPAPAKEKPITLTTTPPLPTPQPATPQVSLQQIATPTHTGRPVDGMRARRTPPAKTQPPEWAIRKSQLPPAKSQPSRLISDVRPTST